MVYVAAGLLLRITGVVIEWTSVYLRLYYTKGRQVARLELVDIQTSVDGSRHVLAGPSVKSPSLRHQQLIHN